MQTQPTPTTSSQISQIPNAPRPAPTPVTVTPDKITLPSSLSPSPAPIVAPIVTPVQPSISAMSDSVYKSLAPLDVPSKPIVYQTEPTPVVAPIVNVVSNEASAENKSPIASFDDPRMDERAKLESILQTTMNASVGGYNKLPGTDSSGGSVVPGPNRFSGNMWVPRMQARPLPLNYRCVICKKQGHPKNMCPEAGTLPKPEERPKFPSGIPKAKMRPAGPDDKFAMLGPDGYVVPEIEYQVAQIVKKDKALFLEDEDEERSKSSTENNEPPALKCPPELKCPLGDHLIKDAVLVPCCGHFICCDECIRNKISNDEVRCPYPDCDQDMGSLESITPYHQMRKMVNDYLNDQKLNQRIAKKPEADPFFDALLDDIDESDKVEPETRADSPLQDSKISSSELNARKLSPSPKIETKVASPSPQPIQVPIQNNLTVPLLPNPPVVIEPQAPIQPIQNAPILPQINQVRPSIVPEVPVFNQMNFQKIRPNVRNMGPIPYVAGLPPQQTMIPHLPQNQMNTFMPIMNRPMNYPARPMIDQMYTQNPVYPNSMPHHMPGHSMPQQFGLNPAYLNAPGMRPSQMNNIPQMMNNPPINMPNRQMFNGMPNQMIMPHNINGIPPNPQITNKPFKLLSEAEFYSLQQHLKKE